MIWLCAKLAQRLQYRNRRWLGPFKGQAWRIGLMGASSTQNNVMLVLSALERLLLTQGVNLPAGAALAAASSSFQEMAA